MPSRLVLVAPENTLLKKNILDSFGFQVSDARLSDDGRAFTVFSPQPPRDVYESCAGVEMDYDFFVLPQKMPVPRLLICDMDSTIIESETLDDLACRVNMKEQIAAITERAMRGELDFADALCERVMMLKDMEEQIIHDLLPQLKISQGAETLIKKAREKGIKTILVSGGFKHVTRYIGEKLGFDAEFANEFIIKKGRLTGSVKKPIQDRAAKLHILQDTAEDMDISTDAVMAIGDGANDIPMLEAAGYGIAYKAKPIVRQAVRLQINKTDLSAAAYLF